VIINSIYSKPVVKQNDLLLTKIQQDAAEPAVEFFEERATHFFVQVDEITCVISAKLMPTRSKRVDVSLVGEILARKKKADVFVLIPDWKAVGERSFVIDPAEPDAKLPVDVFTIPIKRLMHQAFKHRLRESMVLL
jgi:hypothetical protein